MSKYKIYTNNTKVLEKFLNAYHSFQRKEQIEEIQGMCFAHDREDLADCLEMYADGERHCWHDEISEVCNMLGIKIDEEKEYDLVPEGDNLKLVDYNVQQIPAPYDFEIVDSETEEVVPEEDYWDLI